MKYLCLAFEAEATFTNMAPDEWEQLREQTLNYVNELQRNGKLIATNALQSARTARQVAVREGKVIVTDGPFIETKEQLGGFFLIETRDANEAMQIAARWPGARFGTIEVRPIEEALRIEGRY